MSPKRKRSRKLSPRTGSSIQIPKKYISLAVVFFCLFIIGGGVYNILEEPRAMLGLQSGFSSLHPYLNEQTSTEGWIMMLINAFTILGFYMTHRGTQVAYNRITANRWLMGGIALIILGFGGNYLILQLKQSLV